MVTGTVTFSIGLAPVHILTTEPVVATVRPERAGMAAAVTETGAELGGALGVAVLGSVGVAAYRHGLAGSGLPADGTPADAVTAAGSLLAPAVTAYTWPFALMALVAAVLVAIAAIPVWRVLRPTPEPSDMVARRLVAAAE